MSYFRSSKNGINYESYNSKNNSLILQIHKKMKIGDDGRYPISVSKKEIEDQLNKILKPYEHEMENFYQVQIFVLVGYFTIQFKYPEDFLAFNLKYAQSSYGFEQD